MYLKNYLSADSRYPLNSFDIMSSYISPLAVVASYLILEYSLNLSMLEFTMAIYVSRLDRFSLVFEAVYMVYIMAFWSISLNMRDPQILIPM